MGRSAVSARVWLRRAYDPPTRNDGYRVLIDRIWPRGVSRERARLDEWVRELAPSDELRRWFGHDPRRWEEFQRRYRAELELKHDELDRLVSRVAQGRVTLVYGARDEQHNNAAVVRQVLDERRSEL